MDKEYMDEVLGCLPKEVDDEVLRKVKSTRCFFLFGFCDMDLAEYDFSSCSLSEFSEINFNSKTAFPDKKKLPKGFDVNFIEKALKREKLKDELFDAEAALAVIDNPAVLNHEIYENKKIEFVPYQKQKDKPHFHMHGVLSNIYLNYDAPNLSLVVYTHSWEKRAEDNLKALKDVERRIKSGQKILAVSVSDWLLDKNQISEELILKLKNQLERLKELDCVVIDSEVAGKTRMTQSYFNLNTKRLEIGYIFRGEQTIDEVTKNFKESDRVLVPASPIYADAQDDHGYVAEFCPGFSWIIPQIAFLYCQTRAQQNIDYDTFAKIMSQSFSLDERGLKIFDFEMFKRHLK